MPISSPTADAKAQHRFWRRRLAELDRAAAVQICGIEEANGLRFDEALEMYLATGAGAAAFTEYGQILDALAALDHLPQGRDHHGLAPATGFTWLN